MPRLRLEILTSSFLACQYPQLEESQSISLNDKGPIYRPNWNEANPHPKPERGESISRTTRGPIHIANAHRNGATAYSQLEKANPYPQMERGQSVSQNNKGLVHIPNQKGPKIDGQGSGPFPVGDMDWPHYNRRYGQAPF